MTTMRESRIVSIGQNSILQTGLKSIIDKLPAQEGFPVYLDGEMCAESEVVALNPDVIVVQDHEKDYVLNKLDFLRKKLLKQKVLMVVCGYNEKTVLRYFESGFKNLISANNTEDDIIKAVQQVSQRQNYISDIFSKILVFDLFNMIQDQAYANLNQLTPQENRILNLICEGFSNKEIGERLDISKRTVETHRRNIKSKMEAKNTADLVKKASLFM